MHAALRLIGSIQGFLTEDRCGWTEFDELFVQQERVGEMSAGDRYVVQRGNDSPSLHAPVG